MALLVLACAALAGTAAAAPGDPQLRVLSNRADLISGGDALVQLVPPAGIPAASMRVYVDGRDATGSFALRPDGRWLALLQGLRDGPNVVTAKAPGGAAARITIVNHPVGGPVTAGPQIQPWRCFAAVADSQCNRDPQYQFLYKSTAGGALRAYDPDHPPSDVATTTTDQGRTVPYVVRQETGSIDRDEYRIAVLYDPTKPWAPWAPQDGYNHKLVVTHGASCDTAYAQASAPDVLNETALSRGFAVMSHALDNAGHNCNIALQAEALIMTKERVVEKYGEIRYTIGSGCSGGSLVQQQVANAYPGFYQGITPACSFTDAWSSAMQYIDYVLMRRYFEDPSRWGTGVAWKPTDVAAVEGHPNPVNSITFTTAISNSGEPTRSCPGLPADRVYDEKTNPAGVRCTIQDYMVNVFGRRDPSVWGPVEKQLGHGFAGRPYDNVGIEYGRRQLVDGTITPEQFVDLNTRIGAGDIDMAFEPKRTEADRPALERVYRSGAVNQATYLDRVAIIDLRGPDPGAFHDVYRTYAMRARLEREHGRADNQVLWRGQVPLTGDSTYTGDAIVAMDGWLAAIEADRRRIPLAEKVVQDKPDSLKDRCADGAGHDIPAAECDAVVQSYSTPRIQAGMPFADDTIKCELRPLRRSSYYPVQFTDAQWAELQEAFPTGVCDYSKPGVDRVPPVPWLSYANAPGGEPLGRRPVSRASAPCVDRRKSAFRLGQPRGGRVVAASAYVNGRLAKRVTGRRVTRIVLARLPAGRFTVKIVARTSRGTRTVSVRRYSGCRKGRPRTTVR
ncbi:MAG TPA: DUF6351 family protein [Thermoleophilaceae bacterium]|jgi:hypothetical protein